LSSVLWPAATSSPAASIAPPFDASSSGAIAHWPELAWLKQEPTQRRRLPVLTRFWQWLTGSPPPEKPDPTVDLLAVDVTRRQRKVADRLSRVTGKSPEELMDYRRADGILRGSGRGHG
jgi:hypothetical protein